VRGGNVARTAISGDGWLHTGDLGRLDEDGRLAVLGRQSDVIITGGENVAPEEVEAVLLEHPAVQDAAVIAALDPEWGEAVVARVVTGGQTVEEHELRRHCAERLAGFKVPKQIVRVEELPRGSTGKLLRREVQ
jgi:acyl-CoA synthetase (AMP-forming)/AMP-acid ligase II